MEYTKGGTKSKQFKQLVNTVDSKRKPRVHSEADQELIQSGPRTDSNLTEVNPWSAFWVCLDVICWVCRLYCTL